MAEETIDHFARNQAATALANQTAHERVCAERWEASRAAMVRVEKGVTGLYNRWWGVAVGLVLALFTLILTVAGFAFWLGDKLSKIPSP